jgi:two-component system, NarL family, response regulator DevR
MKEANEERGGGEPGDGAIEEVPQSQAPADRFATLSPQERRLLTMVADGLTDQEIGERLSMPERAVAKYVEDMLGKLGLQTRTQAILFAINRAFQGEDPSRPPLFNEDE